MIQMTRGALSALITAGKSFTPVAPIFWYFATTSGVRSYATIE
jgi:hypothetical protein